MRVCVCVCRCVLFVLFLLFFFSLSVVPGFSCFRPVCPFLWVLVHWDFFLPFLLIALFLLLLLCVCVCVYMCVCVCVCVCVCTCVCVCECVCVCDQSFHDIDTVFPKAFAIKYNDIVRITVIRFDTFCCYNIEQAYPLTPCSRCKLGPLLILTSSHQIGMYQRILMKRWSFVCT